MKIASHTHSIFVSLTRDESINFDRSDKWRLCAPFTYLITNDRDWRMHIDITKKSDLFKEYLYTATSIQLIANSFNENDTVAVEQSTP